MTTRKREDEDVRTTKRLKSSPTKSPKGALRLDSIEKDIHRDAKIRAEAQPVLIRRQDPNYVDYLTETMLSIPLLENHASHYDDEETRQTLNPNGTPDSGQKIELEIRIGEIRENNAFVPGIGKTDFDTYIRILKSNSDVKYVHTKQVLYYYEISEGANVRVEYDKTNNKCLSSELKQKLRNFDLELSFLPYACRFSIASEESKPSPPTLPPGYKVYREKNRWSFSKADWNCKVDLTEVITHLPDDSDPPRINYELEFEFDEEVIKSCRNADKAALKAISIKFWDFANKLLNFLYKSNESHFDKSLSLQKITDESELRDLRETCVSWIPGVNTDNIEEFPGSMPVNFAKEHVAKMMQNNYFVSEKTDGIRCMLMILPLQGVFLTDRKFDFYRVEGFDSLINIYASSGITLLDGEMVTHLPTKKQTYLIFDIIALNGSVVAQKPLKERLFTIGTGVVQVYRENVGKNNIPEDHPFTLIGKQFLPIGDLYKLLANIKIVNGQRCYIDEKRNHRTDGLIFTPFDSYHAKKTPNLLKWKYLEELSIDLEASYSKKTQAITWSCVGRNNSVHPWPISLRPNDLERLTRYLSVQKETNVIMEVCFDVKSSTWKFKCIRTDKSKANFIDTVTSTVAAIHEGIQEKDLLGYWPPKQHSSPTNSAKPLQTKKP